MRSIISFFFTIILAFDALLFVKAGIFVIDPQSGSTCHGGKPCTVTWLDDGSSPLLTAVGVSFVGLYTGKQKLVQTITPVDVSSSHSLTFTPIPEAGPNSDTYYISFISHSAKQNNSLPYAAYSPFFKLDKMTGSFDSPNHPVSATATIPIPSSIIILPSGRTNTGDVLSTITVGSTRSFSTSRTGRPTSTTTIHSSPSSSRAVTTGSSSATSPPSLITSSTSAILTVTISGSSSSGAVPNITVASSLAASATPSNAAVRGGISGSSGTSITLAVLAFVTLIL